MFGFPWFLDVGMGECLESGENFGFGVISVSWEALESNRGARVIAPPWGDAKIFGWDSGIRSGGDEMRLRSDLSPCQIRKLSGEWRP